MIEDTMNNKNKILELIQKVEKLSEEKQEEEKKQDYHAFFEILKNFDNEIKDKEKYETFKKMFFGEEYK